MQRPVTFTAQNIGAKKPERISRQAAVYCVQHVRALAFPFLLFAFYFPFTDLYQDAGKGMA